MMKLISSKLLHVQNVLSVPKNQRNTFGNYNYRSCEDILEAVKPILQQTKLLLTISDTVIQIGDRYYVEAKATLYDLESDGVLVITAYAREEENKKGMDAAQITGSTSSYARKYALNGMFNIDDTKDSDSTNTHGKEQKQSQGQSKPTQNNELICSDCLTTITPGVQTVSVNKYGKALCMACQKKQGN